MVVHLGVVVVAVAFAASQAYEHQAQLTLSPGKLVVYGGHSFVFQGMKTVEAPGRAVVEAVVRVDGHDYFPGVEEFAFSNDSVPSPAVRSTAAQDVYLTLASTPDKAGGAAGIGVITRPLMIWLWTGGALMVFGALVSLLRARPGRALPALPGAEAGEEVLSDPVLAIVGPAEPPAEVGVGVRA